MAVRTMLLNGRLFDSVSGGIVEHASILINGERVETVSAGEMAAPEGVEVVDFGGQTVVPGLIDTHVHYALDGDEALKLFVANGRDLGPGAVVDNWNC
jgi:imidazolonepropionase-like amidohydrolase